MPPLDANGDSIVPTRVGVNRGRGVIRAARENCPHARGGEPKLGEMEALRDKLSPRAWG